jgi:hypothetical protein
MNTAIKTTYTSIIDEMQEDRVGNKRQVLLHMIYIHSQNVVLTLLHALQSAMTERPEQK